MLLAELDELIPGEGGVLGLLGANVFGLEIGFYLSTGLAGVEVALVGGECDLVAGFALLAEAGPAAAGEGPGQSRDEKEGDEGDGGEFEHRSLYPEGREAIQQVSICS